MSDFHYVRTMGPEGGVDAADGRAIGLDLEALLDKGLPPFNIAIQIVAAVAEILAIAEEDHVVHGNLDVGDVFIDNTGAVSVEGFGQTTTTAPERTPAGPATDRFGLGSVAYSLLAPGDLPQLPEGEEAHENAAIDAILALNLEGLPEDLIGDIQWYVARLLAWQPVDRPTCLEAWRAFGTMNDVVEGPPFTLWCEQALDGEGIRRDADKASRPMKRRPLGGLEDSTVSGGPLPKGSVNFEDGSDLARSTAYWTRQGMKTAMQKALASDYMDGPEQTDWMPGTPIPPLDRHTGPAGSRWTGAAPVPKRAPGEAASRASARSMPSLDADTDFEFTKRNSPTVPPIPDHDEPDDEPDVDTDFGTPVVPTTKPPTPKPTLPRQAFQPPPSQNVAGPGRPKRAPPVDPNTAPQLVQRPHTPLPPPKRTQSVTAEIPLEQGAAPSNRSGPIPEPDLSRGPDPFADIQETGGPNWILLGGVAFMVALAVIFCLGVGGVGGMAALVGIPTGEQTAKTPKPRATPAGRATDAVAQAPKDPVPTRRSVTRPTPKRSSPRSTAPITPVPTRPEPSPAPVRPSSRLPTAPGPAPTLPVPTPYTPGPAQPTYTPPPAEPMPGTYVPAPVNPSTQRLPSLPTDGLTVGDSILPYLVPEPAPNPDGSGPSSMQNNMRAHLRGATAARDAVILGDVQGAKAAAQALEFINPPEAMPPSWLPYIIDLKMEAWLLENSPDLAAAGFKVAQIGQSCAICHEGTRAGPVLTPSAVPEKFFPEKEVMTRHAWAVDWMWVGLLANDANAWRRGADELAGSPFPSVILTDFPDQKFMELEDKLHTTAVEGQAAATPDQRALVYGRLLSTCARCHTAYRDNK